MFFLAWVSDTCDGARISTGRSRLLLWKRTRPKLLSKILKRHLFPATSLVAV